LSVASEKVFQQNKTALTYSFGFGFKANLLSACLTQASSGAERNISVVGLIPDFSPLNLMLAHGESDK
jgi:hypothetical protein